LDKNATWELLTKPLTGKAFKAFLYAIPIAVSASFRLGLLQINNSNLDLAFEQSKLAAWTLRPKLMRVRSNR
jgi:hypothetical protein